MISQLDKIKANAIVFRNRARLRPFKVLGLGWAVIGCALFALLISGALLESLYDTVFAALCIFAFVGLEVLVRLLNKQGEE